MNRIPTMIFAGALAGTLSFSQASAENYALLVGASTYDNLDEKYWLKGPANDVALVREYLLTSAPVPFSTDNVLVLADGVGDAPKPTLSAIRSGFASMADQLQPGDFVYLHFSGHGTQAPAANADEELDGLDELFLPVDIGPWNDTVGTVENALVDDEIGQLIGLLRAKGATVWAVFDSCHSGTVTRGSTSEEEEVRLRKLTPDALGVPDDAMADAQSKSRALPSPTVRPQSPGGEALLDGGAFVAFYAAQTNETTPEKRLPRGKPGRKSQGVFTYTIFETLSEHSGLTYRQLGQEVLRKYAVQNLALSTPMFEGDLDSFVFSGEAGEKIVQWPVREGEFGLTIKAGHLQNLSEGDLLAILPSAASTIGDAIGYVRISFVDTFTAELEAEAHNGLDAIDPSSLPRGSYARRLNSEIDFSLTVALPETNTEIPPAMSEALAILTENASERLRLVEAGKEADVRLAILPESPRPDAVWMLPGTGFFETENLNQTPSIGIGDRSGDEIAALLEDNFNRMARAFNLLKMAGHFDNLELNIDLRLRTKSHRQKQLTDMDFTAVPILLVNDQVHILAINNESYPVDANVLHIGSDYSISHFFSGRLQPGDTLKKGLFKITDEAFGRDRVVIIFSPADSQSPVENLKFLSQSSVETLRGGSDEASGLSQALRNAGFGTVTRGAAAIEDDSGPTPVILQFDIDTVAN